MFRYDKINLFDMKIEQKVPFQNTYRIFSQPKYLDYPERSKFKTLHIHASCG